MGFKVVSLFSGGGGLDLGFIQEGYNIIWAIDNQKDAVETYKMNVDSNIICSDINEINIADIPKCDVVIGGPPCQSFSLAGNRYCDDQRGQLVWKYIDIINYLHPQAFLFENVTGLMSAKNSKGERILDMLLSAFREIGYKITWQVVNAADYGVPQCRRRVIIVGSRHDLSYTFPVSTHNVNGANGLKKYVSVKDVLDDLPLVDSEEKVYDHEMPTMSTLDKYIVSHVKPGGNYMDIPDEVESVRIKRLKETGGHTTCYGRMHPDKPAYTINTYFNRPNVGCNIHYKHDRLITVREALRLQSFPDSYRIIANSKQGRNLIVGNAVPPKLAKVLAAQLKEILKK